MMGMSIADARDLSWGEYQAVLLNWNERHQTEGGEQTDAPAAEYAREQMAILEKRGIARSIH